MFLALVVLICSSSLALGRSPIPFRCPAVPIKDPGFCARALVPASNCKIDSDCKGGEKCCPALCGTRRCKGSPVCRKIEYDDSCRYRKIAPGCKTIRECPPGTQCCPAECGINQCIPLEDRPGCPSSSTVCVRRSMECFYDQQCKNGRQCCFSENCGYSCVKPQPKCPRPPTFKEDCTRRFILPGCKGDADCETGTLCCPSECGVKQCVVVGPRPGCPRINPDIRCIRFAQDCLADVECEGAKCCLGSCGFTCIGGSNTNPKDEKPGTCPARPAFVPKECLNNRPPNTCKDDFNCPKPWQKCCSGLCGNLACTDAHADKRCPSYRRDISCKRFDFKCSSKKICRKGSICCPESCGSRCVALKPRTRPGRTPRFCRSRKKVGRCRGRLPRFYYDRKSNTCIRFIYGGCRGNRNNFRTKQECEQKCIERRPGPRPTGPSPPGQGPTGPSPPGPPGCFLPKRVGPCDGAYRRYFYCAKVKGCVRFIYGGCGGNKNNFKTKRECEQTCTSPPVNPCPVPGCIAPPKGSCTKRKIVIINGRRCPLCLEQVPCPECSLPKKVGPCRARIPRYFFNKNTGLCGRFFWGGCQPNKNNFKTFEDCQRRCGGKRPDCSLPKKVGPCEALIPRYFYNKKTLLCEKFTYGGCEGNENNFESLSDCQAQCKKDKPVNPCPVPGCIAPPKGSCTKRKIVVINGRRCPLCLEQVPCPECSLPRKVGPCKALIPRYFFNKNTGLCERFSWGGCQPNKNNFKTFEDCQRRCGGKKPVCGPVCAIFCPFGNVLDDKGCPTCRCKTGCKGNAKPVGEGCAPGKRRCPGGSKCIMIPGGTSGVCCRQCPLLRCKECELGNVIDENGCRTCQCNPDPCKHGSASPVRFCTQGQSDCPKSQKCVQITKKGDKSVCCPKAPCIPRPCPRPPPDWCTEPTYYYNEDGVRCPGCYKRVPCDNKPCPQIRCSKFCEFGSFPLDGYPDCPSCDCKQACEDGAKPLSGVSCGSGSQRCPGNYKCSKSVSSLTKKRVCCPISMCIHRLLSANREGHYYCRNKEPKCGPVCLIFCEFGNVLDDRGCPTCECKPGCENGATPGKPCRSDSECFAKPGSTAICVKNGSSRTRGICCSKGGNNVCPKGKSKGRCSLSIPPTNCGQGQFCRKNVCCDIPCPNGPPLVGETCSQFAGGPKCPPGSSCLGGPADEYFACCPNSNGNFVCPKPIGAGICVELCSKDSDCSPGDKCCSNGCGHVCRKACRIPMCLVPCLFGSILDKNGCETCNCKTGCKNNAPVTGSCEVDDRQCPRGDKCVKPPGVPTKRGVCCSQDKPGQCPTPIGAGTCVELCSGDGSCPRDQKCCSNGCGHVCTDPVKPNPVKCQDGSKPLKDIFCGRGPNRRDCPDDYSCYIDPTDRFAVCCKVRACTKIGCRFPCEHGSFPDKNGCPTCNCKPAPKKRYP